MLAQFLGNTAADTTPECWHGPWELDGIPYDDTNNLTSGKFIYSRCTSNADDQAARSLQLTRGVMNGTCCINVDWVVLVLISWC